MTTESTQPTNRTAV